MCSPDLYPSALAASAAILRNHPRFLEFLRLRIADIETSLGNLTVSYGHIRNVLRASSRVTGDRSKRWARLGGWVRRTS